MKDNFIQKFIVKYGNVVDFTVFDYLTLRLRKVNITKCSFPFTLFLFQPALTS